MHCFSTTLLIAALATLPLRALAHGSDDHAARANLPLSTDQHAFGVQGDPKKAGRTITMSMDDSMHYSHSSIDVRQGETVTFVIANKGKLMHELVIGTDAELKQHAELMRRNPTMEHEEPYMAHVKPGSTQRLTWTFNRPGSFMYGCLVAGHFEAGMKGTIAVAAATDAMAEGEVRKVDMSTKKITIKHGELRNLDMPAMTMVFLVKDPAMLKQVKAGDKVRFRAEKISGAFTVIELQAVE
jgi:uncharacterized cupredoxin-like copper-binding protein